MDELTKEKLIQTPKKKHRWIFIVYSVLCILSIINCVVYVSPKSIELCLTLCIYLVLFLICQAAKISKGVFIAIGIVIYIVVISFFLRMFVYTSVTYRHPWQYERVLSPYRQYERNVSYFPETIPDCATDISLRVNSGIWKDSGFVTLSFTADDAYIQECKEKHIPWFFEYNGYNSEGLPDYALSDIKEVACADLYPIFDEQYKQHFTPDYMKVFSVSKEEAVEQAMGWVLPRGVRLTEEELRSAKQYHICEAQGQGFIIVEDTNRIIFYKDNEH